MTSNTSHHHDARPLGICRQLSKAAGPVSQCRRLALAVWVALIAGQSPHVLAQAPTGATVPLSVSIEGLPNGLAPRLATERLFCGDGNGELRFKNPDMPLRESTITLFEWITLPNGTRILQDRQVTRYIGNFQLPYGPQPGDPSLPSDITECNGANAGLTPPNERPVAARILIDGMAAGRASRASIDMGRLAVTYQVPQIMRLNRTLAATTEGVGVPHAQAGDMARGMRHLVEAIFKSDMDIVQPTLTLTTVPPQGPALGTARTLAELYRGADGRLCVKARGVVRCLGDEPGPLLHGDLRLWSEYRDGNRVVFAFEFLQSFPTGPIRLVVSARNKDLDSYTGPGGPVPAPLLPWQAKTLTMRVQ